MLAGEAAGLSDSASAHCLQEALLVKVLDVVT
jgi:hypothetical protein